MDALLARFLLTFRCCRECDRTDLSDDELVFGHDCES